MEFIPEYFIVPKFYEFKNFSLQKLMYDDAQEDYECWYNSIPEIITQRGLYAWSPNIKDTLKGNLIDLGWHQREFEYRSSFSYKICEKGTSKQLGCAYIYPPDYLATRPAEFDADISFWLGKEAFIPAFYAEVYKDFGDWVKNSWPFKNPYFSNVLKP